MNRRPPMYPDQPCAGQKRSRADGLNAITKSLELAIALREDVNGLTQSERPAIAPHRHDFDVVAWKVLVAYLVEERRLTEFLLGPVVYKRDDLFVYGYPEDICVDCFTPMDRRWRFTDQHRRNTLYERANRINARLTHFSWTLGAADVRTDYGTWNTHYLNDIITGISQFGRHLDRIDPELGALLAR